MVAQPDCGCRSVQGCINAKDRQGEGMNRGRIVWGLSMLCFAVSGLLIAWNNPEREMAILTAGVFMASQVLSYLSGWFDAKS